MLASTSYLRWEGERAHIAALRFLVALSPRARLVRSGLVWSNLELPPLSGQVESVFCEVAASSLRPEIFKLLKP